MATNFPTGLDALTNPTSTDTLNSPSHAGQHTDANDAIEALEAKVGVNGSAVTSSHDYKIAGLETNALLKTLVDAKGDLLVGTAADTVARLGVGSNGDLLVADSGATEGVRWQGQANTGRNLVMNGAMQVAQRGTSTTGITGGGYFTADRWGTTIVTQGTWTQTVENDGPTGSGFGKSLKMLCTTADASPDANDSARIIIRFEGQDLQRIKKGTSAAEQLALSFWVKSNVTGTYVATLLDADNSRQVGAQYTVSASATWEKKTIIFPADTTGAFDNDNAQSMDIILWLGAGSNRTSGTLRTSWTSTTTADLAVGQTNVAAATNNYWQVTGVQLEVGPVATGFDFEPYETTLRKCQRYYYLHVAGTAKNVCTAAYYNTTILSGTIQFPVTMRTTPTLSAVTGTNYFIMYANNGSDTFDTVAITRGSTTNTVIDGTGNVSGTTGHGGTLSTNNASASIALSAEL